MPGLVVTLGIVRGCSTSENFLSLNSDICVRDLTHYFIGFLSSGGGEWCMVTPSVRRIRSEYIHPAFINLSNGSNSYPGELCWMTDIIFILFGVSGVVYVMS